MEENDNSFKSVATTKKSNNINFVKGILVPFASGIIGASLVIGTCFGIPKLRGKILDSKQEQITSQEKSNNQNNSALINAQTISLEGYSETAMGVADKVLPSIVGIQIEYKVNSFFGSNTSTATGSGIIISEDGYILTNNHVVSAGSGSSSAYYQVSDAVAVKVTLYNDDTVYDAKIVGKDDQTDLAVIKIEKDGLKKAELGNSDSVRVGEFVMAVGCPLGLNITATSGIVSAVNRDVTTSDGGKYNVIQTDAAINSGNSGGALVNSKGEVIGINTLKLSGTGVEGIGFAIPISSTTNIVSQLMEHNKVLRPYIGISGVTVDEELAKRYKLVEGVYVKTVDDFSSAQKSGIRVGDVVTEVEGNKVTSIEDINSIKNNHNIGDEIKLKIYRDGETKEIKLTLSEQP